MYLAGSYLYLLVWYGEIVDVPPLLEIVLFFSSFFQCLTLLSVVPALLYLQLFHGWLYFPFLGSIPVLKINVVEIYKWLHVVSKPMSYSLSFQVIFYSLRIFIDLTVKSLVMIIMCNPDYLYSEIAPKGALWRLFFQVSNRF